MRKYIILSLFLLSFIIKCLAQDTVLIRNKLTDSVTEKYYVLKSNNSIRQGPYQALFKRKQLIALGAYRNGNKTGIWQFFNRDGRLIEKYDYTKKEFTFEAPLVPRDNLSYFFDDTLKNTDRITRPLKIGGNYYGLIPYVNIFHLPFETLDLNTDLISAYVELLISPLGRLAAYKVYVASDFYNYYQNFNLDVNLFSEEDKSFIPATLNGKRVICRIVIKCAVNDDAGLDFF